MHLLLKWLLIFISIIILVTGFYTYAGTSEKIDLYVVPNFHPACMGWLVKYSRERNYCLYSYLEHLDRVAEDKEYKFVFSELPHLITMMEFEPERFAEFKQRIKEGRIEVVNAFVLEPTVNLSGGEALVQQGVQGLNWYREVMGLKPRYCWMIDTVGWHEQMAQIVHGLSLDAFVYCRYNPTTLQSERLNAIHWIQSPDGTRVLAFGLGHYYRNFSAAFRSESALPTEQLNSEIQSARKKKKQFPPKAPILLLGGAIDYSLPFAYKGYPSELIAAWNKASPELPIRIATFSEYVDVIMPDIRSGVYRIPVVTSGSCKYGWTGFWVNAPFYKQLYRISEHNLQNTEAISTIASLEGQLKYPSQNIADCWLMMALNMDRNSLWCGAVEAVFCDANSWDARDRFTFVEQVCTEEKDRALRGLTLPDRASVTLFNPLNWVRKQPFIIELPAGQILAGQDCQPLDNGKSVLVQIPLGPLSLSSVKMQRCAYKPATKCSLPDRIETSYYSLRVDPQTGALVSLKLKSTGREILAGPANVVLAESGSSAHQVPEKSERSLLASSSIYKPFITVTNGNLVTTVDIRSNFYGGGQLRRIMLFYNDSRRIDFVTETNNVPAGTVLSVQFPLAGKITEVRRGIPYGFSHGAWGREDSELKGITGGIIPVIRWSDYTLHEGGGVALLDRGLPARELVNNTPVLLLHNVCDTYYKRKVTWLNHPGRQTCEYAIVVREQLWNRENIPQIAWEYNCPVLAVAGRSVTKPRCFIETSDNVIVQALRQCKSEIELRLLECLGEAGKARIKVNLDHTAAALTNLLGQEYQSLEGGPDYTFDVRAQQIVTLRLRMSGSVPSVKALRSFESVIPPAKRQYMGIGRDPSLIGHPPTE
jgi:alpha-mannosidase